MRIEQVVFKGFKSLHDLTLPLGDMTVLTGPNGSGKSNILDGLEFLGNLYRVGLDRAVTDAGGYDRVAYRREAGPALALNFEINVQLSRTELVEAIRAPRPGDLADLPDGLSVRHLMEVTATAAEPVSNFALGKEGISVRDSLGDLWVGILASIGNTKEISFADNSMLGGVYDRSFLDGIVRGFLGGDLSPELIDLIAASSGPERMPLLNNMSRYFLPLRTVRNVLASLQYFQLVPQVCRRPAIPGSDVRIGRHGEDLAAAAEHVRQHDESAWHKIQEATVSVVPGLERVEVFPTEDSRLALRFYERGVLRPWRAAEASDGTVQAFALFTALYDRRLPLLAVEEPENALHPWILREFVDLCQTETSKQVVLTTHSPALIDYVPGEWVHLVWREEGATRVGRLLDMDPDAKKIWESGKIGLFDIYDGGVVPRSVPGA